MATGVTQLERQIVVPASVVHVTDSMDLFIITDRTLSFAWQTCHGTHLDDRLLACVPLN